MFKNLMIYRLPKNSAIDTASLEGQLSARALQHCAPGEAQSIGWVAPRQNGALALAINGRILLALGVEQKLLPATVVKQFADSRAKAIEAAEGRRVGRKELRELREAATMELLPRAFIRARQSFGWIDPIGGWLVIDAPSPAVAEGFLEELRKSVDNFPIRLLKVHQTPTAAMTGWVAAGEAPSGFTIDQDLSLESAEHAQVRYVKHTLEGDDVREHIAAGKVVRRVAMTWNDRISFVLDEKLAIKRLVLLDILKEQADGQAENEDERFDLDFTLMSGETSRMIDELVKALGGELAEDA